MIKALILIVPLILIAVVADTFVNRSGGDRTATPSVATSTPLVEPAITIAPETIQQGEPMLISIEGLSATTTIESLSFNGRPLDVFMHGGKPSAIVGIDLKMRSGAYPIIASMSDGRTLEEEVQIGERTIVQAPLGIPDNLGGNTPAGERNVITALAKENAILEGIPTEKKAFWSEGFIRPLPEPVVVTDTYGYTRLTGASTISHKGTDYRAAVGVPIMAMNNGVVRIAQEFIVYGKTIVIDHGFGLHTLYMHLSEIDVEVGDTVTKEQIIGKSGKTGYSEFPHLHISVKIDGISIDPEKFLELL
jgi:hypothetical protein